MLYQKSVLKQSKLAADQRQAAADSVCIYVFVCSQVFPQGERKEITLQFCLNINLSNCDIFFGRKLRNGKGQIVY